MTYQLTEQDAQAVARIVYAVHQRRAQREAAEQAALTKATDPAIKSRRRANQRSA